MDLFDIGGGDGGTLHLSSLVSQAMVIRYSAVANLTIWLYEFLLTIDTEIRLVWPSRLTIIKLLYMANRYLPLLVTFSNLYFLILNKREDEYICKSALLIVGYASFTGFFLAEAVLALRVYVIWQARKSVLFIVVGALFAKTGASCAITYYYLTSAYMSPINVFSYGCECIFTRRVEWITMLFVFVFEILILSMMVIAKRMHLQKHRSDSELFDILLKDGVVYCICIMGISLINLFVVKFAPTILSPFLIVTQGTLHNILCARLLLHLRDTNARRTSVLVPTPTPTPTPTLTTTPTPTPTPTPTRMKMEMKMKAAEEDGSRPSCSYS